MKTHTFSLLGIVLASSLCAPLALAGSWSLGASALHATSPYRGADDKTLPFPIVNYDGDSVYLQGLSAGYYLWKDPQNQLSLTAEYLPFGFKPSSNDYGDMKHLDRRDGTVMAGLRYKYSAQWGIIRTAFLGDILDNSNGLTADLAYLYPFNRDKLTILPGIGASWASSNQNDYYYGVSQSESRRSGIKAYDAGDGWSPYAELTAIYALNENWNASLMARYTRLSSEVKDSPMVDAKSTTLIGVGMTYSF
ncbi:MipA/OmpV family protein [Acerihabitans sp. TG2]|uniref:MipA/OmpV family protein n=1 Tax=Acerihabitans sp. TG2 TaxID=3096008 RepID=UPI002B22B386|nr:MipA/OmpV family protein [Acerihabitans sp. TG2]MEA9389475.1 MipA/OmpV family protein [Acerihabitans sp. TG2]